MEAALSFGSNQGDRIAMLSLARQQVLELPGVRELGRSALYETDPVDVPSEYSHLKFVNSVLVVDGNWTGPEWIDKLHKIESSLGRVRGGDRNSPRPIDVDLLYLGREILDGTFVTLPHPRWAQRRFVLQPLADVRPTLILPGASLTVQDLLNALPPGEHLKRLACDW